MPNEAPTAETAHVDFAELLRNERAHLQAQLKELGFADQGSGLNYDSNFADSSQVTAERGEAERLATGVRERPRGGRGPRGGGGRGGRSPFVGCAKSRSATRPSRRCRRPASASST